MIKILENGIRIIIVIMLLWFVKNLYTEIKGFLEQSRKSTLHLDGIQKQINSLSARLDSSKKFYEENQKIIDETKISDEDMFVLTNEIFKDITNKKLGFFTIVDFAPIRDAKFINIYNLKISLSLNVSGLFSLDEIRDMLQSEVNKQIEILNKNNQGKYEISLSNGYLNENNYLFDILILKFINK